MKKPFNLQTSTEKEREKIIEIITEDMKGIVYANAETHATNLVKRIFSLSEIRDSDDFEVTYNIKLGGGYLRAALGKIRRKKEKSK